MDICVLTTASADAVPHCSLMAYVFDEACRKIYMATHRSTKKYKNLHQNPAVSLLIDSRETNPRHQVQALTVTGVYRPLVIIREKEHVVTQLLERHPHLIDFIDHPDTAILGIKLHSFLLLNGIAESHFASFNDV
jgi:nitroimidazol reductase NimA-like FMN-containing flavoprotein (pyridoxamine 5'-phosphate oxidase superfamily)